MKREQPVQPATRIILNDIALDNQAAVIVQSVYRWLQSYTQFIDGCSLLSQMGAVFQSFG